MAQHIYLETEPDSNKFKYRGEAGSSDDPVSFTKGMGKNNLKVEIRDTFNGLEYTKEEAE